MTGGDYNLKCWIFKAPCVKVVNQSHMYLEMEMLIVFQADYLKPEHLFPF